jgi:hypothetical protein
MEHVHEMPDIAHAARIARTLARSVGRLVCLGVDAVSSLTDDGGRLETLEKLKSRAREKIQFDCPL